MGSEQAREVLAKAYEDAGCIDWAHDLRAGYPLAATTIPLQAMLSFATTAREQALSEAAEKLDAHADMMEGPHIVQDATAKIMATATRDCVAIVRSLIKEPTQ